MSADSHITKFTVKFSTTTPLPLSPFVVTDSIISVFDSETTSTPNVKAAALKVLKLYVNVVSNANVPNSNSNPNPKPPSIIIHDLLLKFLHSIHSSTNSENLPR